MQPKLRATVTIARSQKGILFRIAEQFLEIKGKDVWSWFQRIKPLLSGRLTTEQISQLLDTQYHSLLMRILETLQKADMLYDATNDDYHALPEDVIRQHSAVLARIEEHTHRPVRAFAGTRSSNFIVAGEASYISLILEACAEVGIAPQAIYVAEKSVHQMQAAFVESKTSIRVLSESTLNCFATSAARLDALVLAGPETGQAAILAALDCPPAVPVFLLAAYADYAVAAALMPSAGMGCLTCLSQYYSAGDRVDSVPSRPEIETGVRIAARLVVQQLLDSEIGALDLRSRSQVSDVNLQTFEVRCRAFFPHPNCKGCPKTLTISIDDYATNLRPSGQIETMRFWKEAEQRYVDSKTGLIAEILEGRLLQIPYHQSAAMRYVPLGFHRQNWITEAGQDIYQARIAVLLRMMERYLCERLPATEPGVICPTDSSVEGLNEAPTIQPPGVVVSAPTKDELSWNAFLQALAHFAHSFSREWSDVDISEAETILPDDLALGYFRDIDLLSDVRVQRNLALSRHGLEVLGFARGPHTITVVAGLNSKVVWETGLRDVWLDVTAQDAFGAEWDTWRTMRFRAAYEERSTIRCTIQDLLDVLDLQLNVSLLNSPILAGVGPFMFAYAAAFRPDHEPQDLPVRVMSEASLSFS